jgi:catechol 2,3-dioxygenase-like lactoylglutathione lyase family enzyme
VPDIDQSTAFYRDLMGAKVSEKVVRGINAHIGKKTMIRELQETLPIH